MDGDGMELGHGVASQNYFRPGVLASAIVTGVDERVRPVCTRQNALITRYRNY